MQEPMDSAEEARDDRTPLVILNRHHLVKTELGNDIYLFKISFDGGSNWHTMEMTKWCGLDLEKFIQRQPNTWVCDNGVTHDSYCDCNPPKSNHSEENYLEGW